MTRRFAAAVLAAFLVAGPPAAHPSATVPEARPPLHFDNGLRVEPALSPSEYTPRPLKGGSASDTWEYAIQFHSGLRLLVSLRITNIGPGSEHAQLTTATIWPDGSPRDLINNGRPKGEWTLTKDEKGFTLNVARHTVQMAADRHHLVIQGGTESFDIELVPTAPPYRAGRVSLGASQYYDLLIVAPRLSVRGTVTDQNGARRDLGEGTGILWHTRSNAADYDRALSEFTFHGLDGPSGLSFLEFTEAKSREQLGLLLLVEDGHVSAWPGAVTRRFEGLAREARSPKYPLPASFTLAGADLTGGGTLHLLRRDDLLAEISSSLFRFVVRQVTHPIEYAFAANYEFAVGRDRSTRVLTGAGLASLAILNDPPSGKPW